MKLGISVCLALVVATTHLGGVATAAQFTPGAKCNYDQQAVISNGKMLVCRKGKWDKGVAATPLRSTFAKCKLWKANKIGFPVVEIADQGKTLAMDSIGKYEILDEGLSYADLICALRTTKAPSYVQTQIETTRAIDGMQQAEWGAYKAFWTYHPDDGATLTITTVR